MIPRREPFLCIFYIVLFSGFVRWFRGTFIELLFWVDFMRVPCVGELSDCSGFWEWFLVKSF